MQIVSSVLDTLLAASSGGVLTEPQGKLIHKTTASRVVQDSRSLFPWKKTVMVSFLLVVKFQQDLTPLTYFGWRFCLNFLWEKHMSSFFLPCSHPQRSWDGSPLENLRWKSPCLNLPRISFYLLQGLLSDSWKYFFVKMWHVLCAISPLF
jgi:hypothetical protein